MVFSLFLTYFWHFDLGHWQNLVLWPILTLLKCILMENARIEVWQFYRGLFRILNGVVILKDWHFNSSKGICISLLHYLEKHGLRATPFEIKKSPQWDCHSSIPAFSINMNLSNVKIGHITKFSRRPRSKCQK